MIERKKHYIVLGIVCAVLMTVIAVLAGSLISANGRVKRLEAIIAAQEIRSQVADENQDISNGIADRALVDYYKAMDELTTSTPVLDDSEKDLNVLDKLSRKIATYWASIYSNLLFNFPAIVITNLLFAVIIALHSIPLKAKPVTKYAIFGIGLSLNLVIFGVLLVGGYFNKYYLGFM